MQDRFKFRAFDKKINAMRDIHALTPFGVVVSDLKTENNRIPFENCIVMQCTGLRDNNGTLIFEGDIVKYNEMICDIVFFDYSLMAHIWRMDDIVPLTDLTDDFEKCPFEVIGNIYENPELIGGAE